MGAMERNAVEGQRAAIGSLSGVASGGNRLDPCHPGLFLTRNSSSPPMDTIWIRMGVLRNDLDLTQHLLQVRSEGASWIPSALNSSFRRRLRREVDAGPFRRMSGSFGKVRMEIEGYDVAAPFDSFPVILELSEELGALVRSSGKQVHGLATWVPNEIGVTRYQPGSLGITPHLNGKWYRRLVAVVTVYGRSRFAICRSREGGVMADWRPGPGDLVLLRGPGLGGLRDGRPFHLAEGPRKGLRCSLGVRMAVDGPS
jgi:hypothetical protein